MWSGPRALKLCPEGVCVTGAKIWVTPEPEDGSICTEETNTIGDSGSSQHVGLRSLFVEIIMKKISCD